MSKKARQLEVKYLPIKALKLWKKNPRLNTAAVASIVKSIGEFGYTNPILVRRADKRVIAGDTRVKALQEIGETHAPVILLDLTEQQADAYAIFDNKSVENTPWDLPKLADVMDSLKEAGVDLELTGFSADDIAGLSATGYEASEQDDVVPEPPKKPVTKPGDLWLLGENKHRLLCGDSTKAEDVERVMGGGMAYLMATDPPYGVDFSGAKYNPRAKEWDGIANDKLTGDALTEFLCHILERWFPFMDRQSAFYFWTAAMEEGAAAAAAMRQSGLHIQSQIIWNKNAFVLGQADYQWKHENCWYAFWKGEKHRWFGGRDKTTVWDVSRVASCDYEHPMQKPVALFAIPIEHHTQAGEVVAEPFAGSGPQFIAAEKLNRRCMGLEIEPKYCDVIVQRWETFTGQKARREK